ncbi:MAG: hypothetical protein NTY75_02190 [Candidatus Shapirobacteria bacterium]|nr:hypothetical protein [Candidatus Shapirobacteria bacterium]
MSGKMDLSLLPSQAKFQVDKLKWVKRNRLIIGVICGLWVTGLVVVILLNLVSRWQFDQADKKLTAATKDLTGMAGGVVNSQRLKYNAKLVGAVLDRRYEYGKAFKTVTTMFPDGVVLDKFDLKGVGAFSVDGRAIEENISKVEKIMADINQGSDQRFSNMTLESLSEKEDIWSFSAEVKLK